MALYSAALGNTLRNEGGFQSLSSDTGNYYNGVLFGTNYGITFGNFVAWRISQRKPAPTLNDLKSISVDEVADFYRSRYWDKISGDLLSDENVAIVVFDAAVLCGTATAVQLGQAVAAGASGQPLLADGVCGPKTVAAINSCKRRQFVEGFVQRTQSRFLDIAQTSQASASWLPVWLRRAALWLGRAVP